MDREKTESPDFDFGLSHSSRVPNDPAEFPDLGGGEKRNVRILPWAVGRGFLASVKISQNVPTPRSASVSLDSMMSLGLRLRMMGRGPGKRTPPSVGGGTGRIDFL